MASSRPRLFEGLDPVPVAEVHSIVGDDSTTKRKDGPKAKRARRARPDNKTAQPKTPRKASPKKVKGRRFRPSEMQVLQAVACFKPLWELAWQLESVMVATERVHNPTNVGRNREYSAFDGLLFEVLSWAAGSYKRLAENLVDEVNYWQPLCRAVAEAYPGDNRFKMSEKPISIHQFRRFRKRYLSDHLLGAMHDMIEEASVEAVLWMGMFSPGAGSLTNPDPYSLVTGDGCWVPALTSLTRDDAVDPQTGEIIRRYDPDALPYHTIDGTRAASPGYLHVSVLARSCYHNERVILATRLKSAHNPKVNRNDATIAVDIVLDLVQRFPKLRAGLVGMVYDMALSTADFDRLLNAGLIPVSKVPLTSQGKVATQNLGPHDFKTKDAQTVTLNVFAVHGTPCVVFTDGDGIDCYVPLKLLQVKRTGRKNRSQISTRRAIPNAALVPAGFVGAETRVRHTQTKQERATKKSRSRALRIFPESDERFPDLSGRREDSESGNSDHKSMLWNRRCRTIGHHSVELNDVSRQIHRLITALVAYHNRTGADMSRWFGQHQLARGAVPLAQAA